MNGTDVCFVSQMMFVIHPYASQAIFFVRHSFKSKIYVHLVGTADPCTWPCAFLTHKRITSWNNARPAFYSTHNKRIIMGCFYGQFTINPVIIAKHDVKFSTVYYGCIIIIIIMVLLHANVNCSCDSYGFL